MKKITIAFLAICLIISLSLEKKSFAATNSELSIKERKQLLTEVAIQNNIPPELLKAIALQESGMSQFESDGVTPNIRQSDGGIGIMQVTLTPSEIQQEDINVDRLKYDTQYNIEIGAWKLKQKWNNSNLPRINDMNPKVIENWYFAVMAYNGLSKVNDPNIHGKNTYQEEVFDIIREYALLPLAEIPPIQINYKPDSDIMYFPEGVHYDWPQAKTVSPTLAFPTGGKVNSYNSDGDTTNLRDGINGGSIIDGIPNGMTFTASNPQETNSVYQLFSYYAVNNSDYTGYLASSYLKNYELTLMNTALPSDTNEPVGRLRIKKATPLLKYENGKYVTDRGLNSDEFLRLYGIKNGYYDVGNRFVVDNSNLVAPIIGRALIEKDLTLYHRLENGKSEAVRTVKKGEALRVYSVSDKAFNVGNGYFVKKSDPAKFYVGFVTLKKDTKLYLDNGNTSKLYHSGEKYRVYKLEHNKIYVGGGDYFLNDDKVEYMVH
ncbi:MAG: transglycosylase SLT domain-containing protein [Heyndrickxia sp.]